MAFVAHLEMEVAMFNRIFLLVVGVIAAYLAVWSSSTLGLAPGSSASMSDALLCTAVVTVGLFALLILVLSIFDNNRFDDVGSVTCVNVLLICCSFLFGAAALPIGNGVSAGTWWSPWLFLLVLGFVPWTIAVKDAIVDLFSPK